MAGERLPARFLLRSQLWFRWTGKCFETATSHMQTVMANPKKINTDKIRIIYRYFEKLDYLCSNKIRIKYG